jgi:3-isopropylmalate/(R)-2-methylmalate dehydratase large subunit
MTVVCGDSHTSTHGAFACLAHGMARLKSSTYWQPNAVAKKSKTMLIAVDGKLGKGVTAKDVALAIIGTIGTAGGNGYAIEFGGSAIRGLSMEGRMTLCNMAIEGGARMGFVAVDDKTIDYLKGRPFSPKGDVWEIGGLLAHAAFRCRCAVRSRRDAEGRGYPPTSDLGYVTRNGCGH